MILSKYSPWRILFSQISTLAQPGEFFSRTWRTIREILLSNLYLYTLYNSREFFSCPWNANTFESNPSLSLSNTCPWNSRFYISLTLQCICQYRWEKTETKKRILRFDCSSLNFITSNGNLASKKRRLTRTPFPPFCLIDNLSFSPVTNHRSFRLSRVCFPFLSIFLPSPLSHTRASRDQN